MKSRWLRLFRMFLLVAVIAIFGLAAYQIGQARTHLYAAGGKLLDAATLVKSGSKLQSSAVRSRLRADFVSAHNDFAAANSNLWLWRPALDRLGWLPVVGSQISSAGVLSGAGEATSASCIELLDGTHRVWPVLAAHKPGQPLLVRLLPALARGHRTLNQSVADAFRAREALRSVPKNMGSASVSDRVNRLRRLLPALSGTARWLGAAPGLLGWKHPNHILLAWEDRRELRAVGGFIGAANFITIKNGIVQTQASGSVLPREVSVPLPAPEAVYTYETNWLFRDSNWSPDFPLSARYERWMYGMDTGRWPSMVIDVLDGATAILRSTGPLYLPQYHQYVTAKNAVSIANKFIYENNHPVSAGSGSQSDQQRKAFLGTLMTRLIYRIGTLHVPGILALGAGIDTAIRNQQILLWDRNKPVEKAIVSAGASGAMAHPAADYLYVVDDNRSYSKLNPYVSESAVYNPSVQQNGSVEATLTVRYHVNPSPANLEGYGPMFGRAGSKHEYWDFLRVYVPPGSKLESASGLSPSWQTKNGYALTQFSGRVVVPENRTKMVTFHYQEPASSLPNSSEYRLTVQHQPGADLSAISVRPRAGQGVAFPSSPSNQTSFHIPLSKRLTSRTWDVVGVHAANSPSLKLRFGDPYVQRSWFTGGKPF